jgi:predicted ATP-dependent endonuclease of OLD family
LDLGYRAADLMQANSVIWVEGPSDRIYLNHWIKAVDPDLIEGLHYSIMFYGGRLLSHLTAADDPEVTDFISLRRLNRYITILIDSDREKSAYSSLNETKRRIRKEFDEGKGFAWVTQGREIENYIPPDILLQAVQSVHSDAKKLALTKELDHALHYKTATNALKREVNKVKVAHEVAKLTANLDVLDLRKMIEKLIKFIREANE